MKKAKIEVADRNRLRRSFPRSSFPVPSNLSPSAQQTTSTGQPENHPSPVLENGAPIRGPWSLVFAGIAFLGLWLAYPPVGLSYLAWCAPAPLIVILLADLRGPIRTKNLLRNVYFAALMFWLVTFYFIPYPHPILILGWFVLSAYLAVYTPLFFLCAQIMILRWRIPALIAVPVAWTGLESVRVHFLTGFGMVCLSHTQYQNTLLIQTSDLFGAYAVTFAMTACAAGIAQMWMAWRALGTIDSLSSGKLQWPFWGGLLWSVSAIGLTLIYGLFSLSPDAGRVTTSDATAKTAQIALIQTSLDTTLKPAANLEELRKKQDQDFQHRTKLTHQARLQSDSIDLIVWPESAFMSPDYLPSSNTDEQADQYAQAIRLLWSVGANDGGRISPVALLTGNTTYDSATDKIYNSAILIDETGTVKNRYFKNHRVMIGEYLPVIEYFPNLMKTMASVFPIGRPLSAGQESQLMDVDGVSLLPNICFETTVPHYIRGQLNSIAATAEPDVLLNLTNDGWFFGTTCLDLHFACNVFRAIEMRKPMLVCANTGFSGHIDGHGRILEKGPRRETDILICDVSRAPNYKVSVYRRWGPWAAFGLRWLCVVALFHHFVYERKDAEKRQIGSV